MRELCNDDRTARSARARHRGTYRDGGAERGPAGEVVVFDDKHRIVFRTSRQKINAALDRASARPHER